MLVSHRYKFIYLKSRKTAGTSTEAFLERYCVPPEIEEEYTHTHGHRHIKSKYGIIGDRQQEGGKYPPHSTPMEVKRMVGKSRWEKYIKIVNVRNPYDAAVSYYHWTKHRKYHVKDFGSWLKKEQSQQELNTNLLFWELPFHNTFYVKYESLDSDIDKLREVLNLPIYSDPLPTYKTNLYKRKHYTEYYDKELKQIIDKSFSSVMEKFNYSF